MRQVTLDELMVKRGGSITPKNFGDETFQLFSIPSYDTGKAEIIKGSEIGSSKKLVEPKDVLLSKIVPHIRRCWVTPDHIGYKQIASGEWIQFRSEIVLPEYLRYFLLSDWFHKHFMATVKGVGGSLLRASPSLVAQIKIPFRLLAEQKQIAAILDAADSLRQKDQQLVEHYTALSQSLFLEMFGNPVSNPLGWHKDVSIKYCKCIVPGRDKPKAFTGEIPWLTTSDLNHLGYSSNSNQGLGLTAFEIETVRAKVIPKCSVILTCVGDLGTVSINTKPVVVNQQLHTFQCDNENISPVFMMYALAYQTPYMYKMSSSTTVPYMNKTICNNIPMIYPPINLQNQFTERVAIIEKQKQQAHANLKKSEILFNSLLQRAFTGELTADKAA